MTIDPSAIAYLFEKYININRKGTGAYYTRDEITNYLNKVSIHSSILSKVNRRTKKQYSNLAEILSSLDKNLCKILLTDADSILNTLTILDPAVGCGAFLISSMKILEKIYIQIIDRIKYLSSDEEMRGWIDDFTSRYKSISYGVKKQIALRNLYGVDLCEQAVEVAKLRIYLSMINSVNNEEEIEPLPRLDFNLLFGNSLIGFLKKHTLQEQYSNFGASYSKNIESYNASVHRYKYENLDLEESRNLKKSTWKQLKDNQNIMNECLAIDCENLGIKYGDAK